MCMLTLKVLLNKIMLVSVCKSQTQNNHQAFPSNGMTESHLV